jgi:hypothetical protein
VYKHTPASLKKDKDTGPTSVQQNVDAADHPYAGRRRRQHYHPMATVVDRIREVVAPPATRSYDAAGATRSGSGGACVARRLSLLVGCCGAGICARVRAV